MAKDLQIVQARRFLLPLLQDKNSVLEKQVESHKSYFFREISFDNFQGHLKFDFEKNP